MAAICQSLIKSGRECHRTLGAACATPGAPRLVNKTRVLPYRDGEVASLARNALNLAQREGLNVLMASYLHQARGHRAHGAIVRREGLVELRHHAADRRLALDQIDLDAGAGQVPAPPACRRCRHPQPAQHPPAELWSFQMASGTASGAGACFDARSLTATKYRAIGR